MMRDTGSVDYRIYYVHPLLAGAVTEWGAELDRCAAMGFDHVLVAPILATGRSDDLFLSGDPRQPNAALGWQGSATSALAHAAAMCRERGLRLLMDLVIDRIAEESPLRAAHPALFETADVLAALDPRRPRGGWGAVRAQWNDPGAAAALAEMWAGLVVEWAAAGLAGVRIASLGAVSPAGVRALIDLVRARAPDFRFLGWTPGLPAPAVQALRGVGLDFVFSSLPWWNFRDGWLWEEAALLHRVAATIATPEAPFGPRLAAGWHDSATLRAGYLRALGCAASLEPGWLMPMGFEVAAMQPLPAAHGSPGILAAWRREAPFDLTGAVAAANAARAVASGSSGEARLLTGPGADVIAALRAEASDVRRAQRAVVVLVNADLAAPWEVLVSSLLPGAGMPLAGVKDGDTMLDPAGSVRLAPAETRILPAVPAVPVTQPNGHGARVATGAPRIAIESVAPSVSGGPFAARRLVGEVVTVEADLICDGHDLLAAMVLWRAADEKEWHEAPMRPLGNDRWQGAFPLARLGRHLFAVEAWRDAFATFRDELAKKHAAGLSLDLELEEGRQLVQQAAARSGAGLAAVAERLERADAAERRQILMAEATAELMRAADDRPFRVSSEPPLAVEAERTAAGFASWYELFPRSMSDDTTRHGTFADVITHLPRIRDMGFDVLYLPPIHPIGQTNRKGRNNTLTRRPGRSGQPLRHRRGGGRARRDPSGARHDRGFPPPARCGAGAWDGNRARLRHPVLARPSLAARASGMVRLAARRLVALRGKSAEEIRRHRQRRFLRARCGAVAVDGAARRGAVLGRRGRAHLPRRQSAHQAAAVLGVADRRGAGAASGCDLPGRGLHPAEDDVPAGARSASPSPTPTSPGATPSAELDEYLTELTTTPPREFFRPHFFVNTPDINPYFLQSSGRAGFLIRAALAATLSGLWGIYCGFELCEAAAAAGARGISATPRNTSCAPGTGSGPATSPQRSRRLNRIRRRQSGAADPSRRALSTMPATTTSCVYGKASADRSNVVLVAVSLDPHAAQEARYSKCRCGNGGCRTAAALAAEDLLDGHALRLARQAPALRLDPARGPSRSGALSRREVGRPWHETTHAAARRRPALVQGRDHLPASRQVVLRCQ